MIIVNFLCLLIVIKTTIFLQDINDFTDVNEVYKECEIYIYTYKYINFYVINLFINKFTYTFFFFLVFKENYPARSTFQVGKLPMVWSKYVLYMYIF